MYTREQLNPNSNIIIISTTDKDGAQRAVFFKYGKDRHTQRIDNLVSITNHISESILRVRFREEHTQEVFARDLDLHKITALEIRNSLDISLPVCIATRKYFNE